jgi:quercetin dioxygenase-like cupin family protein
VDHFKLNEMIRGWFVGAFNPTAYRTDACEVGVKSYLAGEYEAAHFHKISTEVTLIVSGSVRMNGTTWARGDIIVLEPGEITDFEALTDAVNVVIKVPGALDDKYLV